MISDTDPVPPNSVPRAEAAAVDLAARALDLAVLPTLERSDALSVLTDLAPFVGAPPDTRASVFAWRQALVHAAGILLSDALPQDLLAGISRGRLERALLATFAPRCIPDAGPEERQALAMLGSGGAAESPLEHDIRDFASASIEALADAQRMVRLAAVVRRIVEDDGAELAARRLLQIGDAEFVALRGRAQAAAAPVPMAREGLGAEVLRARWALHGALLQDLAVLDRSLDADDFVAQLGKVAERRLRVRACVALQATVRADESSLLLLGCADLSGTRLALEAQRSLAAESLLAGEPVFQDAQGDVAVIDRQIHRRLEAGSLVAVPMFAAGPVGVLLVDGRTDRYAALALAAHAAPALAMLVDLRARLQELDVSFRSRYEQRLREVVHEANNPLSVIHNYLHLLGSRLDDESAGKEQLRRIGDEIRRTGDIIGALVDIPGQVEAQGAAHGQGAAAVDLNRLVTDVVGLLEPALMDAASIRLETDLDLESPMLAVDSGRLRQVLLNLLKNSVEAMPDGGSLKLVTRASVVTDRGPGVEIRITDSGPGIPPDLLADLFVAGSSTKGAQRGLGLHIVRRLVEELDGIISAESSSAGTSFRILLPR
ncbi:MAG TPA: ATP-binding protein [Pseudomonadales bacterium]|nr:ATP-binding protein [Pseudomonadales bacterium]